MRCHCIKSAAQRCSLMLLCNSDTSRSTAPDGLTLKILQLLIVILFFVIVRHRSDVFIFILIIFPLFIIYFVHLSNSLFDLIAC